jgi:D-aminopeptidase
MRKTIDPAGWWSLTPGPANAITDVAGVRVGQRTLLDHGARTGVTAILPHEGDLYREPVPAAAEVHNGFGKSVGLIQVRELGQIESPILLTNTFGVSACATALIRRAIAANPAIGRGAATVNPLVLECNDGGVNDIQALHVIEQTANEALAAVSNRVAQGTVGAGTGMRTFGYAGGIGTASRAVGSHVLGALVLANFGTMSELRVMGRRVPPIRAQEVTDKGSVIVLLATDAPLDARQLGRLCRRSPAALGRLGSYMGHGSGDITVAFSTAKAQALLPDAELDRYFLATVEAIEEAVLNAIWHGTAREGYDGGLLPEFRRHYEDLS